MPRCLTILEQLEDLSPVGDTICFFLLGTEMLVLKIALYEDLLCSFDLLL